jgi:DNA-directed RNA polymerase specialized sigma24 family protein
MPVALLSDSVSQRHTSQYEATVTSLAETIVDTSTEKYYDSVDIGEAVRAAILELPPEERAALVLYAGFDLTYDETGRTLGEDRKSAAIRFNRAARKLRNNPSLRDLVGKSASRR